MKTPIDNAKALLQKAANDLIAAQATMATGQALDTVCFHAQQAVEKSLKAILALHDVEYPRRHDLAELIELVKPRLAEIALYENRINSLTPFAVEIRYDTAFDPTSEEANEAVNLAVEFHIFISKIVESSRPDIQRTT
ncbi:MAG: HEPN domain-containing protein [candidate division KSB1 bacterium]|nr:HEPN domain-containing protein [candidate division KSB1 bacterium]MDZ7303333.1 HEPN domain-containing protein [candidate division KSB1 bacterium]MDZ7310417.1 HEPN domain-containing protein [candidate division KSB1 bacterium]